MKKIYIFGAGGGGQRVAKKIANNTRLLGFIDNNHKNICQIESEYRVHSPTVLLEGGYDYVVICSTFHKEITEQLISMGISSDKILDLGALLWDFSFDSRMNKFETLSEDIECVAVGMSYTLHALIEKSFDMNMFNLGFHSQDIYYSCKILEHLFEKYSLSKLKYIIFELVRYSLHYDMSKRRDCHIVSRYFNILGDVHNARIVKDKIKAIHTLFDDDFLTSEKIFFAPTADNAYKQLQKLDYDLVVDFNNAGETARKEHNKSHINTFKENVALLKNLVSTMSRHSAELIFYCPPMLPIYHNNIQSGIENEFLSFIHDITRNNSVHFVDYLRSPDFKIEHYFDGSHLNGAGGLLFSHKINSFIKTLS